MKNDTMEEPPGRSGQLFVLHNPRLQIPGGTEGYSTVPKMVRKLRPEAPVHCLRPHVIEAAAKLFLANFPGEVMYSVKSNPEPLVLKYLWASGIRHFDVASVPEIDLVRKLLPQAEMCFMHPIKSREAIKKAYFEYGIRDFSLDSSEELQKILEMTGSARDLGLHVRLGLPKGTAAHDLSGKFGIAPEAAPALLKVARKVGKRLGLCFHVGSQCMDPESYRAAIKIVGEVLEKSKVKLDVLDIGGGFPSSYPGLVPAALDQYFSTICDAVKSLPIGKDCKLWCEPGRALVAEGGSVVVRVELRKNDALYINDGTYGSLFDGGFPGLVYPVRLIRQSGRTTKKLAGFRFFGPTCDSLDAMKGPFMLPENVVEGDWIEIGQLGAYGATFQTKFNGFHSDHTVEVWDNPIMSMYGFVDKKPLLGFAETPMARSGQQPSLIEA